MADGNVPPQRYAGLPVAISAAVMVAPMPVAEESKMTPEDSASYWQRIYTRFGAVTANHQELCSKAVMQYLIVNGASTRSPFRQKITFDGISVPALELYNILGHEIRRFARANEMFAKNLIVSDANLETLVCKRYNCSPQEAPFVSDFMSWDNAPQDLQARLRERAINRIGSSTAPMPREAMHEIDADTAFAMENMRYNSEGDIRVRVPRSNY